MGFKLRQRNQIEELRQNGFVRKKNADNLDTIESKLSFLNSNIGRLPDQRFVDAVINMASQFKSFKQLSVHQVAYLDYMITRIKQ